jgi:hypothetical protein
MVLVLAAFAPAPRLSATEENLAACAALETARQARDSSRVLADYLSDGFGSSHPGAVAMALSMAEIAAALDAQLHRIEPVHRAFIESWRAFDETVSEGPLTNDSALAPTLSGYGRAVGELEALGVGCPEGGSAAALAPCAAIPVAHLLAVVGEKVHEYLETRYAGSLPEQVAAARRLSLAAIDQHHVLHDLEIAVPGAGGSYQALAASFAGSSLTDTNDPEDEEVKSRLAAVTEAMAALDGLMSSCRDAQHDHAGEH